MNGTGLGGRMLPFLRQRYKDFLMSDVMVLCFKSVMEEFP